MEKIDPNYMQLLELRIAIAFSKIEGKTVVISFAKPFTINLN